MEGSYENQRRYVIYEHISGRNSGIRFVDLSSTHYEEEGKIIRRIDGITKKEIADKIANRHNNRIGFKLIRGLRSLILD